MGRAGAGEYAVAARPIRASHRDGSEHAVDHSLKWGKFAWWTAFSSCDSGLLLNVFARNKAILTGITLVFATGTDFLMYAPPLRFDPTPPTLAPGSMSAEEATMKIAYTASDNPKPVLASAAAAPQAVCPNCGGVVVLRRRQRMDGEIVYFWRHRSNRNRGCRARARPM